MISVSGLFGDPDGNGTHGLNEECAALRGFEVLHIEAARKASCERLLTFNFREFDGLSPEPAGWIAAPTF